MSNARGKSSGGPLALAALNATHLLTGQNGQSLLMEVLVDSSMPLDVQRRALQLATVTESNTQQVISLYRKGAIPTELQSELSFLLHNHADTRIRVAATEFLPIQSGNGGTTIHDAQSVLALQGDARRGRSLFETHPEAACARCHRVNGDGTLVGPDLASIGMKYGGKELLYHIQNPSGAINYNFAAHRFLLDDGRVLSGLLIDRENGQITLGVPTGQYVKFSVNQIEEEASQTVSLMPEGLVANFSTQQLADLIEYLLSLRQGDAISRPPQSSN